MTKRLHIMLLLSQFFMLLALEMTNPFLPLLIANVAKLEVSDAVFYTTLALALPMIATIIMSPLWGILAERWGYKSMLMRASWALTISQGLMIFADSLTWILAVRILQGAFAGFITAMQIYALSTCEWQRKGRQMARLQSAKAVATAVAGLVGGLLLGISNYRGLYLCACLICFITSLVMHLQLPEVVAHPSLQPVKHKAQKNWPTFNLIFVMGLLIMLVQTARFLTDPLLSLAFSHFLHASPLTIGILYSLPAAGILLSTEWIGRLFDRCRDKPEKIKQYLLHFSVLGALIMLAHAYAQGVILLIPIRLLWGIVLAALLPALFTLLHDQHPQPGYALGLANSFAKLGNLMGIFLGGYCASLFTLSQLFLVVALIYAIMPFVFIFQHAYAKSELRYE